MASTTHARVTHKRSGALASAINHPMFFASEFILVVLVAILIALVSTHPGPLLGDVRLTVLAQKWILPHRLLADIIKGDSEINWPRYATLVALALGMVFALYRRWLDILVATGVTVLAATTNFTINRIVARPRPEGFGIHVDQHIKVAYSFPSGHVEHVVAFLGFVIFLTFQLRTNRWWQSAGLWLFRAFLLIEIVVMPLSRTLEGEHWPSDNLAGILLGLFFLLAGIHAYKWAALRWPSLVPPSQPPRPGLTPQST